MRRFWGSLSFDGRGRHSFFVPSPLQCFIIKVVASKLQSAHCSTLGRHLGCNELKTYPANCFLVRACSLYSATSMSLYANGIFTGAPSKTVSLNGNIYVSCYKQLDCPPALNFKYIPYTDGHPCKPVRSFLLGDFHHISRW
jgi:hypothetical protein